MLKDQCSKIINSSNFVRYFLIYGNTINGLSIYHVFEESSCNCMTHITMKIFLLIYLLTLNPLCMRASPICQWSMNFIHKLIENDWKSSLKSMQILRGITSDKSLVINSVSFFLLEFVISLV